MEYYKEANKFSKKYGMDAFKIIAAYEDAADIPQNERYSGWYGDYGIFEPSLNEDMTYDKLITMLGLNTSELFMSRQKRYAATFCQISLRSISVSN